MASFGCALAGLVVVVVSMAVPTTALLVKAMSLSDLDERGHGRGAADHRRAAGRSPAPRLRGGPGAVGPAQAGGRRVQAWPNPLLRGVPRARLSCTLPVYSAFPIAGLVWLRGRSGYLYELLGESGGLTSARAAPA